ncbi:MAG: YraN family protein [Bacteroidetes bacterium]|nr:YraN family protein [Bacteroidota bacterium]
MSNKLLIQKNKSPNQATGKKGEQLAASFLIDNGFEIQEKNWRYHHLEVDIIASKNGRLHIVEVKTRNSLRYGNPEESITKNKMKFLKNAAEAYQYQHKQWVYLQFDVIAITLISDIETEIFLIEDVYF